MLSTLKTDGNSVSSITSTGMTYTFNNVTSNHTLVATFTAENYTITYELDGGSVSGNPTSYTVATSTITLKNPTKTGYVFKGWTGSNGTTPSKSVTIPKGSTGNKSYTANWVLYGDVDLDGFAASRDLIILRQYIENIDITYEGEIFIEAGNVFLDSTLDEMDVIMIRCYLAKYDVTLPHTCGSYTVSYTQKDGTSHMP